MNKKRNIYIVLTVAAILSIVVLEYVKPKKINWFPSYAKQHKIPLGTYVLHEQLERIFTKENIIDVERSPYEYLKKNPNNSGTYVLINNNIGFGEAELDALLDWTSKGNALFIASSNFEEQLLDTLNLETSVISNFNNLKNEYAIQLKNNALHNTIYNFNKADFLYYFSKIDTLNTSVIGVIDDFSKDNTHLKNEHINIIKQDFGKGQIMLSTFPQAFTNYFMLIPPNQDYTAGLLSYIDASKPIYLDNHHKSGKKFFTSPLHILLNTKELKWAYYLMLIGVFIYVIFEGKRKQRAIPIVKPHKNQTVAFTRTIANMYFEKGKHREIAQHKIQYFLDYIRTHLHLNTTAFDDEFFKHLSARSNNTIEDTKALFKIIKYISDKTRITNNELEKLNALIETYKSNNTWKNKI
ncbi:MAG: DUF4350 domain-containing protein [Flavobacteriaceae bacterium]|nr:DUF4350 domain-containing protein [Flavobacteriaceae bacterium]